MLWVQRMTNEEILNKARMILPDQFDVTIKNGSVLIVTTEVNICGWSFSARRDFPLGYMHTLRDLASFLESFRNRPLTITGE